MTAPNTQTTPITPMTPIPPAFPFAALVGQDTLQCALLLAAIDPGIGGVLISGPRGTAKSTSARALAALLGERTFVNLPLGASEAQLIGSIDIERILQNGQVAFSPGLLAKADGGVLYVDEVNLLSDTLADPLLDVAASGINVIEREGVSHRHAARFVLIGTMNPEEGELRPQLSDRFGLAVLLGNCLDPIERQRIVRTRLAFDTDPDAFCMQYADAQHDLTRRIDAARQRLSSLTLSDRLHDHVSRLCIAAAVDGLRADLVMLRAARALAALENAATVEPAHADRVADMVLLHRRGAHGGGGEGDAARERTPPGHASEQTSAPRSDKMPTTASPVPDDDPARRRSASQSNRPPVDEQTAVSDTGRGADAGNGTGSNGHNGSAEDQDAVDEPDWGYLAPESVGSVASKTLRPFSAKKA